MGFINTAGKLVIDCQYDAVSSFWRGYSTVTRKDGEKEEKGAIDPTGKMVIPFGMYEDLGTFSEGLCSAKLNGKWGFADTSGNMVIPARYDSAVYFSEGIAAVKTGKLWGTVNNKGETVFEPQFNRDFIFYGGIADTMKGGRFIYINTAGEQLFGTDYANTRPFGEQLAATMQKASDTDYRFIDTAGKTVFTLECGNAGTFQEGYVWFSRENKFGVADRTGKIIIAPEYQDLYFFGKGFHDGLIAAKKDDKWGIITPQNRTVIPIEHDKIYPFNEGFCIAIKGDEITVFDEP